MKRRATMVILSAVIVLSAIGCGSGVNKRILFRPGDYNQLMGFPSDGKPVDVAALVKQVPELEGRVMTATEYIEQYDRMVQEKIAKGESIVEYRLPPGSNIHIQVWGENLPTSFIIGPHGWIDYPYIGRVDIAGKKIEEVKDDMRNRLSKFIKNPEVLINVLSASTTIYGTQGAQTTSGVAGGDIILMGAATLRFSTNIGYTGRETLVSVLGQAGLPGNAEWRQIRVIRRAEGRDGLRKGIVIFCDMWNYIYFADVTQDIPLMPGDVIYVPSKWSTGDEFHREWNLILEYLGGITSIDGFRKLAESWR